MAFEKSSFTSIDFLGPEGKDGMKIGRCGRREIVEGKVQSGPALVFEDSVNYRL